MAERVVDLVNRRLEQAGLNLSFTPCRTDRLSILGGGDLGGDGFVHFREEWLEKMKGRGLSEERADELIHLYGTQMEKVWERADGLAENILDAQLQHAVEEEMTVTPDDFLIRRSGDLYFHRQRAEAAVAEVVERMADWFHWSESERRNRSPRCAKRWNKPDRSRFLPVNKNTRPRSMVSGALCWMRVTTISAPVSSGHRRRRVQREGARRLRLLPLV